MGLVHQPCPKCNSSDALTIYEDHSYCFSCSSYTKLKDEMESNTDYHFEYLPWRGVTADSFRFFDVKTKVSSDGIPISLGFRYGNGRTKVRSLGEKSFHTVGELVENTNFLFGRDKFPTGSAKYITVTEGELDAISCFQLLGSQYPCVSVSSATSARNDCIKDFEYLNSFERIYLCFDNDDPGKKALQAVASLFDFNKVYHVQLERKDANEYLANNAGKAFVSAWWNAKRFLPQGIISSYTEIDKIIDEDKKKESVTYPFEKLQSMTYGIRTGEVVLVKAPEKVGKTEFLRAIEYHLLKTTDANLGVIHLEEGKPRMIKGLAGYELGVPTHLPDSGVSNEDIKKAFKAATGRDERLHIYTHFDSDDPDTIINTIRFMAGPCGCRYIFLDHLSQLVSGIDDVDERKRLDYIATKLCQMVEDLDFTLFVISHVNDDGKTRGSRYIAKVADLILSLKRDILAMEEPVRNTTYLTIEGNRFASMSGPAGELWFDFNTFILAEKKSPPSENLAAMEVILKGP